MVVIAPENTGTSSAHRPTVLVVEDEALIRMALADHLEDCGFRPIEAVNGDEAIEILQQQPVDAVFSDVLMPGRIDGFGLLQWVASHQPTVPVLLASAYFQAPEGSTAIVIQKPYDFDIVARRISKAIAGD